MARLDDPSRLLVVEQISGGAQAADGSFDRVVRLAQRLFDVPIVAVNLIESGRQLSLAQVGLTSDTCPISESLCVNTVRSGVPLVLEDAAVDPAFADHPAVTGDDAVRFYAGHPLRAHGELVGTLCLADKQPRALSETENRMLADLASWIEQDLVIGRDQEEAREVQRRLLPRRGIDIAGLKVAGHCEPARVVGGDFFDWQRVGSTLQIAVADVMGKGLTAAVVAAGVRALLRGVSPYTDVAAAVTRIGVDSQEDLDEARSFVTMFAARVEPQTGAVHYVDAGHGLAVILQPDGTVRRLTTTGLPLGALTDDSWDAGSETLAVGEMLMVVSDGVLDAFDDPEDAMTEASQLALLGVDPETAVRLVIDRAKVIVSDDVTVVVVRRDPS